MKSARLSWRSDEARRELGEAPVFDAVREAVRRARGGSPGYAAVLGPRAALAERATGPGSRRLEAFCHDGLTLRAEGSGGRARPSVTEGDGLEAPMPGDHAPMPETAIARALGAILARKVVQLETGVAFPRTPDADALGRHADLAPPDPPRAADLAAGHLRGARFGLDPVCAEARRFRGHHFGMERTSLDRSPTARMLTSVAQDAAQQAVASAVEAAGGGGGTETRETPIGRLNRVVGGPLDGAVFGVCAGDDRGPPPGRSPEDALGAFGDDRGDPTEDRPFVRVFAARVAADAETREALRAAFAAGAAGFSARGLLSHKVELGGLPVHRIGVRQRPWDAALSVVGAALGAREVFGAGVARKAEPPRAEACGHGAARR